MAARLTQNRKKYEEFADHAAESEAKLEALRLRFLDLMERDCASFTTFSAAFAMPKETDEDKAKRGAAILNGLKVCTETPLELMELCTEALDIVASMIGRCNDTCISDIAVAALSLKAAVQGAWLNVSVNVASLKNKDESFARSRREKGSALLARAVRIADDCYNQVLKASE